MALFISYDVLRSLVTQLPLDLLSLNTELSIAINRQQNFVDLDQTFLYLLVLVAFFSRRDFSSLPPLCVNVKERNRRPTLL